MKVTRCVLYPLPLFLVLSGCTQPESQPRLSDTSTTAIEAPDTGQMERLAQIWQGRTQSGRVSDYPLGPGDVLEISVPAVEELKDRVVRVSGEGAISLPFVGVVQVVGMTDKDLSKELHRRLQKYMHQPQVSLFVREYRSRQVAVMGAVAKPGSYTLASGSDTILDMLAAAGGATDEAAARILFVPAEHAVPVPVTSSALPARSAPRRATATATATATPRAAVPPLPRQADPIVIDLKAFSRGEYQRYLATPTRPGDIILVPNAGQVLVEGWVDKPGAYKITSELTVLGAVAAAGGPLYPADTNTVKIIRTGKEDGKVVLVADLEKIKRAAEPDIPVRAGDVIEVSSSASKMVPYGLYRFLSGVLNFGASVPLR